MSRSRVARLAVPVWAAAFLLGGCGGGDTSADPQVGGVGQSIGGSVAALAQCRDWREGSVPERLATIEDIRGQSTPQTATNEDSGYSDEAAYDLFERVCAQEYASAYRLYKLYGQAAAFAPLSQDP